MTGAARLAARAAARAGAGLVTVGAPQAVSAIYAAALTGIIVSRSAATADFAGLLAEKRRNAILLGPGLGTAGPPASWFARAGDRSPLSLSTRLSSPPSPGVPASSPAAIAGPTLLTPP